jgi:hypothetical protein
MVLFSKTTKSVRAHRQPPIQSVPGFFAGIKRPGCEGDHSYLPLDTLLSAAVHILRIYLYIQTNTTNKNNVYMLCSRQNVSVDFYGHHQVVAEFT